MPLDGTLAQSQLACTRFVALLAAFFGSDSLPDSLTGHGAHHGCSGRPGRAFSSNHAVPRYQITLSPQLFLDRPALGQLRADLKSDVFDVIYFHSADRIARAAAHQEIFVDEVLKHRKKIVIAGKDYEENP